MGVGGGGRGVAVGRRSLAECGDSWGSSLPPGRLGQARACSGSGRRRRRRTTGRRTRRPARPGRAVVCGVGGVGGGMGMRVHEADVPGRPLLLQAPPPICNRAPHGCTYPKARHAVAHDACPFSRQGVWPRVSCRTDRRGICARDTADVVPPPGKQVAGRCGPRVLTQGELPPATTNSGRGGRLPRQPWLWWAWGWVGVWDGGEGKRG